MIKFFFILNVQLDDFLHEITEKVIITGDLDGIILTGLTPEGVSLFENYINNTCDVQTASLALSFCVPRKFKDPRVTNWVEKQVKHILYLKPIVNNLYISSVAMVIPVNMPAGMQYNDANDDNRFNYI